MFNPKILLSLTFWCVSSCRRGRDGRAAVMVGIFHNLQSSWSSDVPFIVVGVLHTLVICGGVCSVPMNVFEESLLFMHACVLCKWLSCHVHLDRKKGWHVWLERVPSPARSVDWIDLETHREAALWRFQRALCGLFSSKISQGPCPKFHD